MYRKIEHGTDHKIIRPIVTDDKFEKSHPEEYHGIADTLDYVGLYNMLQESRARVRESLSSSPNFSHILEPLEQE